MYLFMALRCDRSDSGIHVLVVAQRISVTLTQFMCWYFLAQEMESPITDITDDVRRDREENTVIY